jgi:hypothetical protein
VNLFNDITWFNKEAFDEALFYVPFFLIPEGGEAFAKAGASKEKGSAETEKAGGAKDTAVWAARVETIAGAAEKFRQAGAESGFRLDRLLEVLSEEGPAKTARPRKAAAKKPASGKKKQ